MIQGMRGPRIKVVDFWTHTLNTNDKSLLHTNTTIVIVFRNLHTIGVLTGQTSRVWGSLKTSGSYVIGAKIARSYDKYQYHNKVLL